ncbi:E3 ubiquitin-protein ligase UPL3-like [Phalaenopsis equestris]|uniref:E3 ubiquitin-protein ligase UPL3-like n=1 Tax=Phalaenopsis equestris TaxID=78828 RepID=UPI0009E54F0C|nr:E3 ubiquitin-protein ligase UPL3-like [Phalaenopsis equestris]
METRSRKRAEASSFNPPATRASKRPRSSSASSSDTPVAFRTRQALNSTASPVMDSDNASGGRRERRNFGRSNVRDRDPPADKGKERDPSEGSSRFREREREREKYMDREAERILGLSFDSGGADDDNDSEGGVSALHQNFSSASSALQGLLRKLGAGLDDLLPSSALSGSSSHQSSKLKKILSGLRADGEEGRQVEALTQLCELLSIGTEDSLGSFSVDSFVPVLVGLLNHESNPDVMLLAARALTHLCDVLPSSCAAVVHYGAVPCFCARLLTIEYMDLAEQSLQALKKISQEHPTACLRAGALMAVLSFLDFFSTGVQRVALCTAANMCKKLPSDAAEFVMEAIPLLTNLLHYHDAKVLEYASVCLTRIAEAFASSPDKLDELCHLGLVAQAAGLVSLSNSGGQASLSTSAYTGLIRLLSTCASGSPSAARTLLLLGISGTLKDILSGSGLVANVSVHPALAKPSEQIYEIVNLADELLPPLPKGTVFLPIYSNVFGKGSAGKKISCSSSGKQETHRTTGEISSHEKLLQDKSELLQQFGMDLLPILTQIYGSSVNGPIRHRCLSVIGKLMYFSSAEMIPSLLNATNISSFLAGVLAWKDPQVLIPALQIADILMDKLPDIFAEKFGREGVIHAIDALVVSDSSTSVPSQSFLPEKDADPISSRSRRHRRHSGLTNTDGGLLDEAKVMADGTASSTPLSQAPVANNSIRATVSNFAKAFKDKHFPAVSGATKVGVTEDLFLLRSLCSKLNANADVVKFKAKGKSKACGAISFDTSASLEGDLDGVISELLTVLCKGNGVSTFEFIGSGVVVALLNYFSCGTFGKDRVSEANLSAFRQQALIRYKSFIKLALPVGVKEGNEVPMSFLVQKLQNALSSLERFPVVLSHPSRSSSGGSARLSSGLGALSQPFKLRLYRAQGEKSLRDYSSSVVLIDPLATLAAVEEFLWPRVQRNDSAQKIFSAVGNPDAGASANGGSVSSPGKSTPVSIHRPTTRSRSSLIIGGTAGKESCDGNASSSKGKGKAVLKSTPDEGKGTLGRNENRRTAASEKDREMKPSHVDSNSEDDNLDLSLVEIDDALMVEEDDVSDDQDDDHDEVLRDDSLPVCTPDRVHDVKLGDPSDDSAIPSSARGGHTRPSASTNKTVAARGSESTELRSGSTFSSRGAMSFAAAAVAGLASVGGRGIRGCRGRRGLPNGGSLNENHSKLVFSIGGKQLSKHMTIYQAIQSQLMLDEDDGDRLNGSELMPTDGSRSWSDIFTITYQTADNQADGLALGSSYSAKSMKSYLASNSSSDARWQHLCLPDSILQGELPCEIEKSNPTYHVLALLRVLEGLNQLASRLRIDEADEHYDGKIIGFDGLHFAGTKLKQEEFINNKLTPKLTRQIQDALALFSGSLPSWCYQLTNACPFLFPLETRRQYFYTSSFGLSRALHHLQQQQNAENTSAMNEREVRLGRLQRQKVRVSRNRILESGAKVMEMYASQKAVLEVEYFGEVGTGLGPTLEFYTLLSHDLQKAGLGLWRSSTSSETSVMQINGGEMNNDDTADGKKMPSVLSTQRDFVVAPLGLFPRPWPPSANASEGSDFSKVVENFRLAGRIMAKALQDGRLLDLPLSTAFYKLVLGQELDLYDFLSFDSEFGKILLELQNLVNQKRFLETVTEGNQTMVDDLHFRGSPIEDLCLDFTLPGFPDYILKEGEESLVVNIENLEEYINLILDATVKTGIMRQMEAFRAGFNQVFDISHLQIFSPHELDYLICGRRELWESETLADHIKFDHGYTAKSPAIINLLEIMAEFSPEQQYAFCQFVTGAPRLPPGGLAALNPKLTIVRKHSSTTTNTASNGSVISESADDDLPSVMTCANFLKLPPYSTKEIMYKKLLYAIYEGQGSFDLS